MGVTVKQVEEMPRSKLISLAKEMKIPVKPSSKVEELREAIQSALLPKPTKGVKKGQTTKVAQPQDDSPPTPVQEEQPTIKPAKEVAKEAPHLAGVPSWVAGLYEKWALVETKIDRLLSAIEVEESSETREPPKEREVKSGVTPPKRRPNLPEPNLEEEGYVSVTVDEVEAMDKAQLIELAKSIGVDSSGGSDRILKKRLINFLSKSAELYESDKAEKTATRESTGNDPQLERFAKEMRRVKLDGTCGVRCLSCPVVQECHDLLYVTKFYKANDEAWDQYEIPSLASTKALIELDIKKGEITKKIGEWISDNAG